jgi:membrane-associated phospholipid phosphatase
MAEQPVNLSTAIYLDMFSRAGTSARGDSSAKESRRLMMLAWGVAVIFLVVDLIWFPLVRLTFASENILHLLWTALAVVGVYAAVGFVSYRLRADQSVVGGWMMRMVEGVGLLIRAGTVFIALGIVGGTFSYLTASLGLPLRDAELAAIDKAMGFDWPAFLAFANDTPAIGAILRTAYHSAGPQLLGLYLLLSLTRSRVRLAEFTAVLAVASLLTGLVVTFVPAEGAYAFYAPPSEMFTSFSPKAGMWHHDVLTSLRTSPAPVLGLAKTEGLVTFPSFHTTLAIIIAYAVRGVRYVFVPVCALNAVMIVATLPEGGHHLIDLIAGALVAVLAIGVARHVAVANESIATRTQAAELRQTRRDASRSFRHALGRRVR